MGHLCFARRHQSAHIFHPEMARTESPPTISDEIRLAGIVPESRGKTGAREPSVAPLCLPRCRCGGCLPVQPITVAIKQQVTPSHCISLSAIATLEGLKREGLNTIKRHGQWCMGNGL